MSIRQRITALEQQASPAPGADVYALSDEELERLALPFWETPDGAAWRERFCRMYGDVMRAGRAKGFRLPEERR